MKQVPEGIITEILLRLPVKSLCRFKCLSKVWCDAMSDSTFVKLHLNQSIKSKRLTYVVYDESNFPRRLELDHESLVNGHEARPKAHGFLFHPKIKGQKIEHDSEVWACNGLLCTFDFAGGFLVLANPSTRESKTILCNYDGNRRRAVDGSSSLAGGFGYDAFHDDYKAMEIDSRNRTVYVYSLRNRSWSCAGKMPDNVFNRELFRLQERLCIGKGLYFNGAIYWLDFDDPEDRLSKLIACITGFDLKTERFFRIPTPLFALIVDCCELFVMRGCLCICIGPGVEFLVMEDDGSWEQTGLTFPSDRNMGSILDYFPNEDEDLFLSDGRLSVFNHRNGSEKEVNIGQIPTGYAKYMESGFSYMDSLVSLGCITGSKTLQGKRKRKRSEE